jgi:SAM-dependent methyltransferase
MESSADWWQTFFSGPMVASWLRAPAEEQTRQEAAFIQEALGIPPPATILDVPCGGGRHCVALASLGFDLTGVDLSSEFLEAARSQPTCSAGSVTWEHREMRDLPWAERFDGAFSFGNSFGYLDDQGNADFLKAVARVLKPGARFVLDSSYVLEILLPSLQERAWYPLGDILMLADRRYDPASGRLHVEYTLVSEGKLDRRSMSARLYSYREIVGLLEDAGFTVLQGYGSLDRGPFRIASGRLLMTAERRRDR